MRESELSREEGYELVVRYTQYYWRTNKFYSLKRKYELEDMIHLIYVHFLEKGFFEKYDSKVTSKKYFVMRGVMTRMVDELRKYRECLSLESEDENGLTLADKIPNDESLPVEDTVMGDLRRERILEQIPDTTGSTLVGQSPLYGEVNFSLRTIALHLEKEFTVSEIAEMFMNPKSGRPVSASRVSQLVKELREYCMDNIVLYE